MLIGRELLKNIVAMIARNEKCRPNIKSVFQELCGAKQDSISGYIDVLWYNVLLKLIIIILMF